MSPPSKPRRASKSRRMNWGRGLGPGRPRRQAPPRQEGGLETHTRSAVTAPAEESEPSQTQRTTETHSESGADLAKMADL